ncbi:MAG: 3-phosphoshikimate 1-carboxyvinyltransferase, partial [Nitriliruptorales bacterium]
VPGDPSSAAFWLVAAACRSELGDGGTVVLPGLCLNPTRLGALSVLRAMGVDIDVVAGESTSGEETGELRVTPAPLGGAVVAGAEVVDTIDELVVLAVAGALSSDGLEVRDAAELRAKESDRISALAAAFRALALDIEERPDGYRVPGGQRPSGGEVDAYGDHRIAMTAAVAATLATGPVEIRGFASVGTSYPSFLADLERLGGRFEVLDAAGEAAG